MFRPHSHSKRSGFKTGQYIEILKNAKDAQLIVLNSGQDISSISPPFLQGVKNKFSLLKALVSKRSNKQKI